jgi:hypothetical protein
LAVGADGKRLLTCGDGMPVLWDWPSLRCLGFLPRTAAGLTRGAFLSQGRHAVIAENQARPKFWRLDDLSLPPAELPGP